MSKMRFIALMGIIFLNFNSLSVFSQTLKEKAESGDKIAQYQYAQSLEDTWKPTEEDYQTAVIWLRKSAEQGYAPAQNNLGYHYDIGQGVKQDYEQAFLWYKKAAEQGNKTAQYNLGVCYANGQGVVKSDYSAFSWYKKSADQGYVNAEYALGKAYYHGKGTTENNKLAVEWFTKAADSKHSGAMFYLGECYAKGYGVMKNMAKAIEWYEKSADDEDTNAEYALALLYLTGDGVEKDSIVATEWLLHSAGGGWCHPHQLFTYNMRSANQNAQKKLLELCELNNSPQQHYFLAMTGCMYDAMQNYTTAEKYYKRAIEQGSYLGTIEIGLMYFYILANTPYYDEERIEEGILLESYQHKDNTACLEYIKTKHWSDHDNVAFWLEKAIEYGFGSFYYGSMPYTVYDHLLFSYVDGIGCKRNLDRAVDIAMLCVADTTLQWGGYEAISALEIAFNHAELHNKLFRTYQELFQKPLNSENSRSKDCRTIALAGLGKCYYKGFGTSKDYNLAFKYLSEAANNRDCESMRLLAACYRYGRGTAINNAKEKEWVNKAADCGDETARDLRNRNK